MKATPNCQARAWSRVPLREGRTLHVRRELAAIGAGKVYPVAPRLPAPASSRVVPCVLCSRRSAYRTSSPSRSRPSNLQGYNMVRATFDALSNQDQPALVCLASGPQGFHLSRAVSGHRRRSGVDGIIPADMGKIAASRAGEDHHGSRQRGQPDPPSGTISGRLLSGSVSTVSACRQDAFPIRHAPPVRGMIDKVRHLVRVVDGGVVKEIER